MTFNQFVAWCWNDALIELCEGQLVLPLKERVDEIMRARFQAIDESVSMWSWV